jgi:hypothetical protein
MITMNSDEKEHFFKLQWILLLHGFSCYFCIMGYTCQYAEIYIFVEI